MFYSQSITCFRLEQHPFLKNMKLNRWVSTPVDTVIHCIVIGRCHCIDVGYPMQCKVIDLRPKSKSVFKLSDPSSRCKLISFFHSFKQLRVFLVPEDGILIHCRVAPQSFDFLVAIYLPGWIKGVPSPRSQHIILARTQTRFWHTNP